MCDWIYGMGKIEASLVLDQSDFGVVCFCSTTWAILTDARRYLGSEVIFVYSFIHLTNIFQGLLRILIS